jgi:hypothetical protein
MRMMLEAPNNFQGAAHPLPVPGGRRQRHSPASSLFFVQLLGYEHVLLVLFCSFCFVAIDKKNKSFRKCFEFEEQVLVTVCGIPNSAELGVRIRNSAESSVLDEILWNPDAARAESADRGRISLWEQAWTRNSAVCTVYENGSPAGEEPPNAKFFVLHAR